MILVVEVGRGLRNFDFALEEHIHAYFLMEQAEEANRESQNSGLFPTTSSAHVPGPYKYLPQSSSCSMVKLPTSTKAATADESTQLRAWSWTEPNTVYEWHWWGGALLVFSGQQISSGLEYSLVCQDEQSVTWPTGGTHSSPS